MNKKIITIVMGAAMIFAGSIIASIDDAYAAGNISEVSSGITDSNTILMAKKKKKKGCVCTCIGGKPVCRPRRKWCKSLGRDVCLNSIKDLDRRPNQSQIQGTNG